MQSHTECQSAGGWHGEAGCIAFRRWATPHSKLDGNGFPVTATHVVGKIHIEPQSINRGVKQPRKAVHERATLEGEQVSHDDGGGEKPCLGTYLCATSGERISRSSEIEVSSLLNTCFKQILGAENRRLVSTENKNIPPPHPAIQPEANGRERDRRTLRCSS